MKSVKEYRQEGYKVRVLHHRKTVFTKDELCVSLTLSPKGGGTEIEITSPEGLTAKAKSKCSDKDNFCRKTGVAIALGRAVKILESKEKLKRMQENNDYSNIPKTIGELNGRPVIDFLNKGQLKELIDLATGGTPFDIVGEIFKSYAKKESEDCVYNPSEIKDVKREGYFQ